MAHTDGRQGDDKPKVRLLPISNATILVIHSVLADGTAGVTRAILGRHGTNTPAKDTFKDTPHTYLSKHGDATTELPMDISETVVVYLDKDKMQTYQANLKRLE